MAEIRGCCPHNCPDTCGWIVTLDDRGAPVKITGDPEHPYTRGWLCAKVNRYLEFVLHPERLRQPLRRTGPKGSGQFEPISWDEALDEITRRWQSLIREHGPESILPYSYSGTLGLVQSGVANMRLWTRMGASALDRTICSAAGTEALRVTVGGSLGTDPEDFVHSRLILLWGTNPASTHPHLIPWIDRARELGARVWLIDPHRTLTAHRADVHLQPRPGSDAALALAMMHVLFAERMVDEGWAREHTVGLDALRRRVAEMTPARAAELTGLSAEQVVALAREYGTTRPAVIRCSMGLQRHSNGGNTVRALACLPALVPTNQAPGAAAMHAGSPASAGSAPTASQRPDPRHTRAGSAAPRPVTAHHAEPQRASATPWAGLPACRVQRPPARRQMPSSAAASAPSPDPRSARTPLGPGSFLHRGPTRHQTRPPLAASTLPSGSRASAAVGPDGTPVSAVSRSRSHSRCRAGRPAPLGSAAAGRAPLAAASARPRTSRGAAHGKGEDAERRLAVIPAVRAASALFLGEPVRGLSPPQGNARSIRLSSSVGG